MPQKFGARAFQSPALVRTWLGFAQKQKEKQVIGGFTWEAGIHWYQRRAHVAAHLLGDEKQLRREVADKSGNCSTNQATLLRDQ